MNLSIYQVRTCPVLDPPNQIVSAFVAVCIDSVQAFSTYVNRPIIPGGLGKPDSS